MDIRGEFVMGFRNGEPNGVYNTDQLSNVLTIFNNDSLNSIEAKKNLEQFMASDKETSKPLHHQQENTLK